MGRRILLPAQDVRLAALEVYRLAERITMEEIIPTAEKQYAAGRSPMLGPRSDNMRRIYRSDVQQVR